MDDSGGRYIRDLHRAACCDPTLGAEYREVFPDLDGLRYNSRFAGAPGLALFLPAVTAMPTRPKLSLPLTHPDLAVRIAGAAKRLGYGVV